MKMKEALKFMLLLLMIVQLKGYSSNTTDSLTKSKFYTISSFQLRQIIIKDIQYDSLLKRNGELIKTINEVFKPSIMQTKQVFDDTDLEIKNFEKIVNIDKSMIKRQGFQKFLLKFGKYIEIGLSFYAGYRLGVALK